MNGVILQAIKREANSGTNKKLRRDGYVPGNIIVKGKGSDSVAVKKDELRRVLTQHGRNAVFDIKDSANVNYTVMVKDIQFMPISNEFMHVDFQKVALDEETKSEVPIKVIGRELLESRRLLVVWQMDTIHVKGLPQDIPHDIEIDVSNFQAGDVITVGSLKLPKGIKVEQEEDQLIASINETKVQNLDTENEENE